MADMQRLVANFVEQYNLSTGVACRLLDLVSEVGELAKVWLVNTGYGRKEFDPGGVGEGWTEELAKYQKRMATDEDRRVGDVEVVSRYPEKRLGDLLRSRGMTIATAESCTGGLIAHLLTNVPGSSDYYLGGVVAYANEVKRELLGVQGETLAAVGAVSREVALQMARGVRRLLRADYALAATGIAGPGGGTPTKPVGLVYLALVGPGVERCERHVWTGDRLSNKVNSARRALSMLVEHLGGER